MRNFYFLLSFIIAAVFFKLSSIWAVGHGFSWGLAGDYVLCYVALISLVVFACIYFFQGLLGLFISGIIGSIISTSLNYYIFGLWPQEVEMMIPLLILSGLWVFFSILVVWLDQKVSALIRVRNLHR